MSLKGKWKDLSVLLTGVKMACIARLLRACSTFNLTHTLSLSDPLPVLAQYLQTCSLEQLSPTLETLKKTHPKLSLAPLETSLLARLEQMHLGQVIAVKDALKKVKTRKFGEKLEDKAIGLLPGMSIEEVAQMLRVFAGKTPRFVRLLCHIQGTLKEKGSTLSLETKISALLSFYLSKYPPDQLLPLWSSTISSHLEELPWSSLCHVLITYAHVAGAHKQLFKSIENLALRNIPTVSSSDLALLCTAQTHISAEFSAKLVPTLEEEIVMRAAREEFSVYHLTYYCRGLTSRLKKVGPALEPQIAAKVNDFSLTNLAAVMYHLGANVLGSDATWELLTTRATDQAALMDARALSWALYGAFYRGIHSEEFYAILGNSILKRNLTIKDAEKVIPVYSKLKRVDVLSLCRSKLLESHSFLPPMRTLTLINFFKEANLMTPQLHQLLRSVKSSLP